MSFAFAPVTRFLVVGLVVSSIAAAVLDAKHYFYILIDLHLWQFGQLWRLLAFQLCYTNSTEVLFAAVTLYHLRHVERMWGPRKYASFVATVGLLSAVMVPLVSVLMPRALFGSFFNYLPAGPTPIVFAILSQYHSMVPRLYQYRVVTATGPITQPPQPMEDAGTITLSDKTARYALAMHLALLQWPGSVVSAAVGWVVGWMWRFDLLPQRATLWRVPGWLVGIQAAQSSAQYEDLRRRLEGESAGTSSGLQDRMEGQTGRRRLGGIEAS